MQEHIASNNNADFPSLWNRRRSTRNWTRSGSKAPYSQRGDTTTPQRKCGMVTGSHPTVRRDKLLETRPKNYKAIR